MAAALMLQGTGSDVGKSLLVAGLCRVARKRGVAVAPFKPQNMSNNAAVTEDGGEIGRAQWLQAIAAGRTPSVHMNPVLLKPQSDIGAQVVVQGRVWGRAGARDYQGHKAGLLDKVLESYAILCQNADLVLIEGAGSPAEVNLRRGDIANMGFARAAGVPVCLVGDIDRGGVIASLVGTHAVLDPGDRAQIAGVIINRFRGDVSLFDDGLRAIEAHTGWRSYGVVPWLGDAARLPAEDAVVLEHAHAHTPGRLKIAAPMLSRLANFDDLDPLKAEDGVELVMVPPGRPLPGDADLVVLLGTKATRADLAFFRDQGWEIDLRAHLRRGGAVLGLCGGYQMLGRAIADPDGIEGAPGTSAGLGLLAVDTHIATAKVLRNLSARDAQSGVALSGYEIHMGRTDGPGCTRPMLYVDDAPHGAVSADGQVMGAYVHGLFVEDGYRHAFLRRLGHRGAAAYSAGVDGALDNIAARLEEVLDIDGLLTLARS